MKLTILISTGALLSSFLTVKQVISAPLTDEGSNVKHVKRQCIPNGAFYDDASYKVPLEYIGAWTHLSNQGSTVKAGTLSYTGQANA